jgi:hypothetical protein
MKYFLFSLLTINSAFMFGQTYQKVGSKLVKTGTSLTVKWTNESGGVNTQKATCNEVETKVAGTINYTVYKCICTTGDYFVMNIYNDKSLDIQYYNELDSQYYLNGEPFRLSYSKPTP